MTEKEIDFCWNETKFSKQELDKFPKKDLIKHILSLYEYVKLNVCEYNE